MTSSPICSVTTMIRPGVGIVRLLTAVRYLTLLFLLLLTDGRAVQPVGGGQAAASGHGLTSEDWQGIHEAHDQWQRAIKPLVATTEGWQAVNRRQRLTAAFDRDGFTVRPEQGNWSWGLELTSYGVGNQRMRVGAGVIGVDGEKIRYGRDERLEEWVINDRAGIEHGFTIRSRPAGPPDKRLRLQLRYRGDLRPVTAVTGQSLTLGRAGQEPLLSYENLRAWDANGKRLAAWFEPVDEGQLQIVLEDGQASYPVTIDPTISQQAFLKASVNGTDGYGDDQFGHAVAIHGNTAVIGAPGERSRATGVNGDQFDNSADDSGAAYVFVRNGTTWSQQAYLKASNTEEGDRFGFSVAIFGETIVIGADQEDSAASGVNGNQSNNFAPESGAAYVFVRNGTTWTQQEYLKASNTDSGDFFGGSVSIHGETIVVGADLESSAATGFNGNQLNNSSYSSGAAYVFTRTGFTWSQQAYLKASNTGDGDQFGCAVAINGETIVVGAFGESSMATGVNGDQANNSSFGSGAVYVFVRTGASWSQQAYLKASNTGTSDSFGRAVAISGNTVVVGARFESSAATGVNGDGSDNSLPEAGAAYVFIRSGLSWSQQAYLKASETARANRFGSAVAIDGETLVVGSVFESSRARGVNGDQTDLGFLSSGAAYVFVRLTGGPWVQQAYLKASNTSEYSFFGRSVSISGETILVGADGEPSATRGVNNDTGDQSARNAGAAYIFVRSGSTWNAPVYLKASNTEEFYGPDYFGQAVAISGETVVVGAWGEDSAATGVNGNQSSTGAQESGAAYVFVRDGTTWTQQAYLKASNTNANDRFGRSVAISGETIVIGAPDEDSGSTGVNGNGNSNSLLESGAAYVFIRNGTNWSEEAYLKASNTGPGDRFGWSVGVSGNTIVVGAWGDDSSATGVNGNQTDDPLINDAGAAYIFVRSGGSWSQQAYLKASNTGSSDNFGNAVAISGETVVVGAFGESSNATTINENQVDDSAPDNGAAYVFIRQGTSWSQQAYLKSSNGMSGDTFGFQVAISGGTIVVGAPLEDNGATGINGPQTGLPSYDSGAAYVFVRTSSGWSQQAYLKASNADSDDRFGRSVAISGETVIVGADREGSQATGVNGDQSSDLAPEAGAAYLFTRSGLTWSQTGYLKASNTGMFDQFGGAVAVSGNTAIVGADNEDSAGRGVNPTINDNRANESGAAYVFLTESSLPQILSLAPSSALVNSGALTLTVNGSNFVSGSVVRWNGTTRATTFVSATQLTASIAASDLTTTGPAIVTVANPAPDGGVSNEVTFTVASANPIPNLTSLTPSSATAGGPAFTLTVNGQGMVNGAIVRWNGQNRTTTFVSGTRVTAAINASDIAAGGTITITVLNPSPGGGVSNVLPFTVAEAGAPAPTIASISPNSANAGDVGFTLVVTGTNFVSSSTILIDGVARPTNLINATTLTAEVPAEDIAAPGTRRVGVRTPAPGGGVSETLPLTVTSLPPSLDSLVPNRVIAGGTGQTLTVFGKVFFNGASIRVNSNPRTTTRINDYQVTTTLLPTDIATPQVLTITVTNPGGAESGPLLLTVYPRVTSVSAASFNIGEQARDSILSAFATNLATGTEVSNVLPLPTTLLGTRLAVTDSAGVTRDQSLFFVSPGQINYHLHAETAIGPATVTVSLNNQIIALGELTVGALAPAIFTQNATGDGVPAGYGLRVVGSAIRPLNILAYDNALTRWVPIPIDPGTASEPVYLAIFGTGFRSVSGTGTISARIGTTSIPVQYAGPSPGFIGLDQLNIGPLPLSLAGTGTQPLVVSFEGRVANPSKVIQLNFAPRPTAP